MTPMLTGPGFSNYYPNPLERGSSEYRTWAIAQTPPDHMEETVGALNGLHAYLQVNHFPYDNRMGPFVETATLDLLGIDAEELRPDACRKDAPPLGDPILMIASTRNGIKYPSLGDILGACGYSVTVASPDRGNYQQSSKANPGITYLRKTTGAFDETDESPGFSFAIVANTAPNMDEPETALLDGRRAVFDPDERLRGLLRVVRPAGRLLTICPGQVKKVRRLLDANAALAEEVAASFDVTYLKNYSMEDGRPVGKDPLMILERR